MWFLNKRAAADTKIDQQDTLLNLSEADKEAFDDWPDGSVKLTLPPINNLQ